MSERRKTVRKWFMEALELELDAFLAQHRFVRRRNSDRYKRNLGQATQSIKMIFQLPGAGRQADPILFYPSISVTIPEVNDLALQMAGGERLLGDTDLTLGEPLEITAPKAHRPRWLFIDEAGLREVVRSLRQFLDDWGLPFLDGYHSAESITHAFETSDERVLKVQNWYVYVAAAYLLLGKPDDAKAALSDKLTTKYVRERFKAAFEYVDRQILE